MPPPDSSLIDDALVAKLLNDSKLKAMLPDGVWWDVAGNTAKKFVIVSMVEHNDVPVFGGRAWEETLYLVKAVTLFSEGVNIGAAAKRIDAILEDGSLSIEGFGLMAMFRERRVRFTERDDTNASVRWLHRGGHYRVQAALA